MRRIGWVDVATAVVAIAGMQIEVWTEDLQPRAASAPLFAVVGALFALRRTAPSVALVRGGCALLIASLAGVQMHTPVSPLVLFVVMVYSAGERESVRRGLTGMGAAIALFAASLVADFRNGTPTDWTDFPFIALVIGAPWFVGRAMRGRLDESAALTRRAQRLEEERRKAVHDERARIARELHDVVAHAVSVMVVQAGAAEAMLTRAPERSLEAIRQVQGNGRQALTEMSYSLIAERRRHAPAGAEGGAPGATGHDELDGAALAGKATGTLTAGQRIRIETPGGGGFGRAR